jgi:hypothetical protein
MSKKSGTGSSSGSGNKRGGDSGGKSQTGDSRAGVVKGQVPTNSGGPRSTGGSGSKKK